MSYNVPTTTKNDVSFGPGRLFVGAAGSTPTRDVGSITEDGITLTLEDTKRFISQGNPRHKLWAFSQEQGVMLSLSGIEWDFTKFSNGVGAGNTTISGSEETYAWGGDPIVDELALHLQHQMGFAQGQTLDVYIWKAAANGNLEIPFGQDEHSFGYEWTALRATTNWAGGSLGQTEELIRFVRRLS